MKSPFLNTIEIAEYLRFVDRDGALQLKAAREWIYRHVPATKIRKRGHAILVHVEDIHAALDVRRFA